MISTSIYRKTTCRVCLNKNLQNVITLGSTPLANAFLGEKQVDKEENYYPLEVDFCTDCTFLQLGHVVNPELLFSNYVYVSSTSKVFIDHFVKFAEQSSKQFSLNSTSLVVDIGSNDGILLKPFMEKGIKVLGVEPAKAIAVEAQKAGINTLSSFMSKKVAREIKQKYGKADIVTATNVFAHIDDLDELIMAIKTILKKDGVFIIEAPYLIDFIQKRYFDLIYHEHLSYWRVKTLIRIFERFDMKVIDVEKVSVHGGSIRVYVTEKTSQRKVKNSVKNFLDKEKAVQLDKMTTYTNYAKLIEKNKIDLLNLLYKIKKSGKKIVGYGAPAKGNTLLNYFNIGRETLSYIVDDSPWKQGLYSPGKRIPVKDFTFFSNDKSDYLLILAWNFAESIIAKNQKFSKRGGKFIIPVPKPKIV
jgi:2-polyprenyl-3-methyl-5-hydroxy-6-metoxy-1,4-benzoquinol methylase